ncbi:DUF1929-domain-containing protein [Meredithblackwellia eburnea MCA 4105]
MVLVSPSLIALASSTLLSLVPTAAAAAAGGKANTFVIVGETGASAQQLFLGTPTKVYIVDKTENNVAQINGHAAWATEYDLTTNTYRALDITTNSFCAGGNLLGNGTWVNVGGNQAVTTMGVADADVNITKGQGAYDDYDGGRSVRVITACSDDSCNWTEDVDGIPQNRWYPSLETLEDGSVIIIGGELYGGFVNSVNQHQSVPTYEFWPTKGSPVTSPFLEDTQPANLYPLTWLLPNGLLFMQADWQTTLLNYTSNAETRLPNITHAQKTYPASGATAMLPLTVANDYTPTLLFCGGMDPVRDDWDNTLWAIAQTNTSSSCVSINPMDTSPTWKDEDDLPENRGMGNFIILPDERLFLANGVAKGSAGYGWDSWAINQSYAQDPVLRPAYYNSSAPSGQRWDTNLPSSTVGRLYHSSATLLPDGSVFIAGSNPNADMINATNNATYLYKTEYRAEIFYPSYYDAGRPVPTGIPSSISYGGDSFDLQLPSSSLNGTDLSTIKVSLIRTGFSTHAMNMGMRYLQLNHTFTGNTNGSATLHVSQLPPNPSLFVPGPALLFVTVNNIPSVGQFVMVGSGSLGTQPVSAATVLPASSGNNVVSSSASGGGSKSSSAAGTQSTSTKSSGAGAGAGRMSLGWGALLALGAVGVLVVV